VFKNDPIAEYNLVKNAIQQSFVDNDATISHHHGVGIEHSPWLEDDISAGGVAIMTGLFAANDPKSNFNPGKIIAAPGMEKSAGAAGRVKGAAKVPATASGATAPAKAPAAKAPAKAPARTSASSKK
jgi:alkyldihydroxyacetonephosphate synthase